MTPSQSSPGKDVNHFHSTIRRSFATEFAAAGNEGGGSANVDMLGGGKSRYVGVTAYAHVQSRSNHFHGGGHLP